MIQKLSHATIYVLDQDSAYDFYVHKLGFEVRTDHRMESGFRWLTVGPKGQPDMEIVLMPSGPSHMMDQQTSEALTALIRKGVMGAGVFETADCRKTYEELKASGVEFLQPPEERFYGIEALFKDDSGNWFSMTQRKR
ncbi:MAG: VOC family protein [Acidobacteria bacterium]|nr:VOC family protein [Acidobacteriota bacterium]